MRMIETCIAQIDCTKVGVIQLRVHQISPGHVSGF